MPARARREEHRLCPSSLPSQATPETRAGACNRFCCAAASITSTAPPGNCCTAIRPSTNPAASCRLRARPARLALPTVRRGVQRRHLLIRAGLSGGKGVPETVATHPCVFTTLTAHSFGPVHLHRDKDGQLLRCRPRRRAQICPHGRRMSCPDRHARDDPNSVSRCARIAHLLDQEEASHAEAS